MLDKATVLLQVPATTALDAIRALQMRVQQIMN
jgi:hypothetical protein